jgi:hypothetical protein
MLSPPRVERFDGAARSHAKWEARPAASLGGRAREQLAQQLPRAANPLGDDDRGRERGLAVGAPVIVAALLNGSEIVKVNDAVRRSGSMSFVSMAAMLVNVELLEVQHASISAATVARCVLVYGC